MPPPATCHGCASPTPPATCVMVVPPDSWWEPPWRWWEPTKPDGCTTATLPRACVSPFHCPVSDSTPKRASALHARVPRSASSPGSPENEGCLSVTMCVWPSVPLEAVNMSLGLSLAASVNRLLVSFLGHSRAKRGRGQRGWGGAGGGCSGPSCLHRPLHPGLRPHPAQSLRGERACGRVLPPVGPPAAGCAHSPRCPAR